MRFPGALPALLFLIAAAGAAPAQAKLDIRPYEAGAECGAHAPQLYVTVSGVTPQGILAVELYRPSKKDFLRKASRIHRIRVPAGSGEQTVCFDLPGAGVYALAAYHDVDADRDLDQRWNGMPAEPFALSNNEPLKFGFPKFEDAAFRVGENGGVVRLELQSR
ncbi:hypothetical protein DDZ14_02345 [Maritimibacter sp. 55A14]|uniref:DUF2141 domain-containing protein n=1 Tax=Maritimibacter sp. 55A14 TaxID=2174844 RepID=UPI000D60CA23|nr:DUF2141 domain-containing protein [Maritimibacter sp. 55A14]PWE34022.1 hypothetical protein DDZ14_02345 [Maritimibacter sp. 55A14]